MSNKLTLDMKYIQTISNTNFHKENDAVTAIKKIEAIIKEEIRHYEDGFTTILNQSLLTLAARVHCELNKKYNLRNEFFKNTYDISLFHRNINIVSNHIKLQSLLSANQYNYISSVDCTSEILKISMYALDEALNSNKLSILLLLLKTINLIYRQRDWIIEISEIIQLRHLYYCLQLGQNTIRDEMLMLLNQADFTEKKIFQIYLHVITYWPWINKNKFYILIEILKKYSIEKFLYSANYSEEKFLAGIRLGLLYRDLFVPSQSVIKVLADQGYQEIFILLSNILMKGTTTEIQNLCLYWLPHLQANHAEHIFEKVKEEIESVFVKFINSPSADHLNVSIFRLTILLNVFSKELASAYNGYYIRITDELIKTCFCWDIETQILIYKFVINNIGNALSLECSLDFIYTFISRHKCLENSRQRNNILAKIPHSINYIIRMFNKFLKSIITNESASSSSVESFICCLRSFFCKLQVFIETEMLSTLYQPKIVSLKLLEILLKCLYGPETKLKKLAKQFHLLDRRKFADYLEKEQIFSCENISQKLFTLINDPICCDDIRELVIDLFEILPHSGLSADLIETCHKYCSHKDIDECNLSATYAVLFIRCCECSRGDILKFYDNTLNILNTKIMHFMEDPLLACKTKGANLFGYISVLSAIIHHNPPLMYQNNDFALDRVLATTETIINHILDLLNITNEPGTISCASFQDMEHSLSWLIEKSNYHKICKKENEDLQKFLLLSLWHTLKACCELTTAICKVVLEENGEKGNTELYLKRCLMINILVLMRCRHKGAIEFAGHCIGILTKAITMQLPENKLIYDFIQRHVFQLHNSVELYCISRTRRGAGYSLMLLHILRNEAYRNKPLLKSTLTALFEILNHYCNVLKNINGERELRKENQSINYESVENLVLHYLCVLVRDTELRSIMSYYYNEIMMHAIICINSHDWGICNAALQLFGALLLKIIGQTSSNFNESEQNLKSITSQNNCCTLTYGEILCKYPAVCEFALAHMKKGFYEEVRSTIVFLEFFQHAKYYLMEDDPKEIQFLEKFRILMWSLLKHPYAKIRQLASICFINAHDFKCDLPLVLLHITKILFKVTNENFFEGLLLVMYGGICKIMLEAQFVHLNDGIIEYLHSKLKQNIIVGIKLELSKITHSSYSLCKLFDIVSLLNLESEKCIIQKLIPIQLMYNSYVVDNLV